MSERVVDLARNRCHGLGVPRAMEFPKRYLGLVLGALLAACTSSSTPTSTLTQDPFDATGDWTLESGSVDGAAIPVLADNPITFSVAGSEVSGQAACNFYGGRLEVADGQVRLGQTSSTAMACGELDSEVMRSEAAFLRALDQVRGARGGTDSMTLFGPTVELIFTRNAPIPVAEIVGTDWSLESVIQGDNAAAAIGGPATLRLDADGTFHGSTGCRTFTGTWIQAQGRLTATTITMAGECPGGLGGQDVLVTEALSGSTPTIEGDRLSLAVNGGAAVIYRRATE